MDDSITLRDFWSGPRAIQGATLAGMPMPRTEGGLGVWMLVVFLSEFCGGVKMGDVWGADIGFNFEGIGRRCWFLGEGCTYMLAEHWWRRGRRRRAEGVKSMF